MGQYICYCSEWSRGRVGSAVICDLGMFFLLGLSAKVSPNSLAEVLGSRETSKGTKELVGIKKKKKLKNPIIKRITENNHCLLPIVA